MGNTIIALACAAVVFELAALGLNAEIYPKTGKVVLIDTFNMHKY